MCALAQPRLSSALRVYSLAGGSQSGQGVYNEVSGVFIFVAVPETGLPDGPVPPLRIVKLEFY
jgi:hypothetical protein